MPVTSSSTAIDRFSFYHLKFFQIIGFFPLSLQLEFKPSPLVTLWSLVLIAGQFLKGYLICRYSDILIFQDDNVGKLQDIMKFVSVTLTHFIILMESFIRRNTLQGFFQKLQTLHDKYPIKIQNHNRAFWQQYAFLIYLIVVEINFYYANSGDKSLMKIWVLHSTGTIPVLLHYFESILILEFIRWELIKLNKSLKDLVAFATPKDGSRSCGMFERYLRRRVVKSQQRYQIIYQMVLESNKFFGHSWAMNILNTLIVCETYIYWIYWGYYFTIFRATFGTIDDPFLILTNHD